MKRLLGLFHAGEQKNLCSTSGQAEFISKYFFKKIGIVPLVSLCSTCQREKV
jgi:hypothetical protein